MREYAMHCIDCGEFTTLGKFVGNEGHFEGEYSLLHNRRANSDELLCRFLIRHARHTLRMEESRTKSYSEAIRTGARFMDGEIDAIVEQQMERERDRENERALERNLGQLELNVLRGLLAGEAELLSLEKADSPAAAQFLLGKEEGVKRAMRRLDELLETSHLLFK